MQRLMLNEGGGEAVAAEGGRSSRKLSGEQRPPVDTRADGRRPDFRVPACHSGGRRRYFHGAVSAALANERLSC